MITKIKDITTKETLNEYFKFKEKYNYKFNQKELEDFLQSITSKILKINKEKKYKTVFIPQTSNKNLIKLAKLIAENIYIVKKNKKEIIIKELNTQKFQKKEKEALLKSIESKEVIKIAEIKGNQRKRFIDILFEDIEENISMENTLLLDDSAFSGFTYKALKSKLPNTTKDIVIFSKEIGEIYE